MAGNVFVLFGQVEELKYGPAVQGWNNSLRGETSKWRSSRNCDVDHAGKGAAILIGVLENKPDLIFGEFTVV